MYVVVVTLIAVIHQPPQQDVTSERVKATNIESAHKFTSFSGRGFHRRSRFPTLFDPFHHGIHTNIYIGLAYLYLC